MEALLEERAREARKENLGRARETSYETLDLHERAQLNKKLRYSEKRYN